MRRVSHVRGAQALSPRRRSAFAPGPAQGRGLKGPTERRACDATRALLSAINRVRLGARVWQRADQLALARDARIACTRIHRRSRAAVWSAAAGRRRAARCGRQAAAAAEAEACMLERSTAA